MNNRAISLCSLAPAVLALLLSSCSGAAARQVGIEVREDSPVRTPLAKLELPFVHAPNPKLLAIEFETGKREAGLIEEYRRQPGDEIARADSPLVSSSLLREGQTIGWLIGPGESHLARSPRYVGETLDPGRAMAKHSYRIFSQDDAAYARGIQPTKVHRKSKPRDVVISADWQFRFPQRHVVYLELPQPLAQGANYELAADLGVSAIRKLSFRYEPRAMRSPAIQVSQVGFAPTDPAKLGVLSLWLGDGGAYQGFREAMEFDLIDLDGRTVFRGSSRLSKLATELDDHHPERRVNVALTDVYQLDFSRFEQPGTYRIVVDGVGQSLPFRIGLDAWEHAVRTSLRGFFHHRAGLALGPPHTRFVRPLSFHKDMGKVAVRTALPGHAPLARDRFDQSQAFKLFHEHATDEVVSDIHGGYHDAGDWDRRTEHLHIALRMFELYELFPKRFGSLTTNIPESANDLPDIVDEAMWGIDLWLRLQRDDGGVRGWVESAKHPKMGEVSWLDSLPLYVADPDIQSSYLFAATLARGARILGGLHRQETADAYQSAAERAFSWAEGELSRLPKGERLVNEIPDARNLAAVEFYRNTGSERYHRVFRETSVVGKDYVPRLTPWVAHSEGGPIFQEDAVFAYLQLPQERTDRKLRDASMQAILQDADAQVLLGSKTAHGFTKRRETDHLAWGTLGWPNATAIGRAYLLTRKPEYLAALVRSTLLANGMNGDNMTTTTGLGVVNTVGVLHIDSVNTGQPPPEGITIYGQCDPTRWAPWTLGAMREQNAIYPEYKRWPTGESLMELGYGYAGQSEYTVNGMTMPLYVWGVLYGVDR